METTLKLLAREVLFSAIHIPVKQKIKIKIERMEKTQMEKLETSLIEFIATNPRAIASKCTTYSYVISCDMHQTFSSDMLQSMCQEN